MILYKLVKQPPYDPYWMESTGIQTGIGNGGMDFHPQNRELGRVEDKSTRSSHVLTSLEPAYPLLNAKH